MKQALIPIKKRILAFATDGEIEAKLRSILARRWGGKDFPKLTEIVYRLYMQWGRKGNGGIFKQGGLSARVVKIIDEAIAEGCRQLGIASWEAKNVVRKLDKEINMAFKRGVTDARLDLKKMGIAMALDRRNEMLFDLNRAYREFDRSVRFSASEKELRDWIIQEHFAPSISVKARNLKEAALQMLKELWREEISYHPRKYKGMKMDINQLKRAIGNVRRFRQYLRGPVETMKSYEKEMIKEGDDPQAVYRLANQMEGEFWREVNNVLPELQKRIDTKLK